MSRSIIASHINIFWNIIARRGNLRNMMKVCIQEVAKSRGIETAYQLMKATNVQPSVAAQWWSNKLVKIGIGTLDKLCEALECTPNDLLVFTPSKKSKGKG